ncbi:hypothetical protein BKA70DRAFT_1370484 [Coprinopsis sp. MPI-PUGE-AT-0042]|nr:hypothetical protein BKA70DRAFT_1370484 [Coprinopsis sp. MPI-PUGE-AT-0042]
MTKFYVRPFEPRDSEEIAKIARRMLHDDPLVDYVCSNASTPSSHAKEDHHDSLHTYISLLVFWATSSKRGAIDLVCTTRDDGEVVAGAAIWNQFDQRRISHWWPGNAAMGWTALEGMYHLYRLGLRGSKRLLFDYPSYRSESLKRVQQVDPSLRNVFNDCWSLDLLILDHGFHKRGLESMLLQAQRVRTAAPILLEVASVSEMGYFREMGFEVRFTSSTSTTCTSLMSPQLLDRFQLGQDDSGSRTGESSPGHDRGVVDVFLLVQR